MVFIFRRDKVDKYIIKNARIKKKQFGIDKNFHKLCSTGFPQKLDFKRISPILFQELFFDKFKGLSFKSFVFIFDLNPAALKSLTTPLLIFDTKMCREL